MPSRFLPDPELREPAPLIAFCEALSGIGDADEAAAAAIAARAMAALVADAAWLSGPWEQASAARYQQHPLFIDPDGRFSVVSFVWGPGQATPIHDHGVWGVVGIARGAERIEQFAQLPGGALNRVGEAVVMQSGEVDVILPSAGDIHRVTNAHADRVSISIHAYGADIGRVSRRSFGDDGTAKLFVSGYSSAPPALTAASVANPAAPADQPQVQE